MSLRLFTVCLKGLSHDDHPDECLIVTCFNFIEIMIRIVQVCQADAIII